MDKWLKVDFNYAGDLMIPPALQPDFIKLLRGCEIVKREYDPREENYEKHSVQGRPPAVEFVDDPGTPLTQLEWEELKELLLKEQADATAEVESDPADAETDTTRARDQGSGGLRIESATSCHSRPRRVGAHCLIGPHRSGRFSIDRLSKRRRAASDRCLCGPVVA